MNRPKSVIDQLSEAKLEHQIN